MPSFLTSEGKIDLFGAGRLKDNPIENLGNKAAEFSKRLESILYFSDIIENKNLIFEEARAEATLYMQKNSFDIVLSELLKAIALTDEYNYPLYIDNILSALEYNRNEIITFTPESENYTKITVDFSSLGEILEWENAVIFARAEMQVGGGEEPDMEAASEYWFSRVYAPGRMGIPVYSYSKKGGAKDVTEKFAGKYEHTISTRLKYVNEGKAPYWYLIEFGNAPGVMQDRGGSPYPEVPPTRFISKSEIAVAKIFELILYRYINKAMNDYAYALLEALQKGSGKGVTVNDVNEIFSTIASITQTLLAKEDKVIEPIDLSTIKAMMSGAIKRLDEFTRRGQRVKQPRSAAGTFVKSPVAKRRLKRK